MKTNSQVKLPHIGYSKLIESKETDQEGLCPHLFNHDFYFAHSYQCVPYDRNVILGYSEYGDTLFPALIKKNKAQNRF